MKPKFRMIAATVTAAALGMVGWGATAPPNKAAANKAAAFMRLKLDHS